MAYNVKFNSTNQYSVKGKSTNQSLNTKFQNTQTINGLSAYEVAVKNGFEGTEQEWLDSLQGESGVDGKDGADGYTPVKGKDYFDGVDGSDGQNGEDGRDGVSPKVDVQTIEGGHRVTVTDAAGFKTFDVMDGQKGEQGENAENDELFIVRTLDGNKADKTVAEIREAAAAGKVCLLLNEEGTVYKYRGEEEPLYGGTEETVPTFYRGAGYNYSGIQLYYAQIPASDNVVRYMYTTCAKTPNPSILKFTGAVEAEYDGSKQVTVNIPEGGTGSEATKELFVVNWFEEGGVIKSDCRAGDIRKAAAEGKLPVLFNWDGKVYIYSHDAVHTNVHPTNKLPTFVSAMEYEPGVLSYKISVVTQTSEICMFGYSKVRTQTPKKLTFTGAVEATFDGGEAITVNIPESGVDEEQLDQAVQEALQEAKDSGLFDGKDGKDGIDGKDGYTPVKGVDYFDGKDGKDGKDGEDGYTPVKGKDYFDGQPGRPGADGADGKDGVDGFSPTVSVSKTGKVTTIRITDKNGTKTATINDGEDGQDAEGGTESGVPTFMFMEIDGALKLIDPDNGEVFETNLEALISEYGYGVFAIHLVETDEEGTGYKTYRLGEFGYVGENICMTFVSSDGSAVRLDMYGTLTRVEPDDKFATETYVQAYIEETLLGGAW
ncbi:MAG: hypothetical protein IKY90_07405 [Oscillospiraceae bacterium]|nr:hypothetical protein [Oscillospiraceae bacterium]